MLEMKRKLVDLHWASGQKFQVHLNARRHGVIVPGYLMDKEDLVLSLGSNLPVPIKDYYCGEFGFGGELSFKGEGFYTFVPFEAVYAIIGNDGEGRLFHDALPESVARRLTEKFERASDSGVFKRPLRNTDGTFSLDAMRQRKNRGRS